REHIYDRLDASAAAIGPGLAEARYRGVDDKRLHRLHGSGPEPELVERARPGRLQEHIRSARKLQQDLDGLWPLEIEHEAALVAVERDKAHALAVADRRRRTAHVALRRFYLDHVGAHVGEQRAGKRARDEIRELDDPNSRQRFW